MKLDLRQLPTARLDFIKPMLARSSDHLPSGADWLYELKLDGYRALVMKKRGAVTLFSRRGNVLNVPFPTIVAACFTPDALHFYVFDLLAYKGNHLRHSRFIALRDDKKATEVVKEEL